MPWDPTCSGNPQHSGLLYYTLVPPHAWDPFIHILGPFLLEQPSNLETPYNWKTPIHEDHNFKFLFLVEELTIIMTKSENDPSTAETPSLIVNIRIFESVQHFVIYFSMNKETTNIYR